MRGGPELASLPLARGVLARWSWRPAGVRGAQSLLGGLAARAAPMLARARLLQAWHDGLAHRWRPLDMGPPAHTLVGGGPAGLTGLPAAVAGTPPAEGSPGPGSGSMQRAGGRRRAVPVRANAVAGAGPGAQRPPATATSPERPALRITALPAPAASSAAPLPVPFHSSTPAVSATAEPLAERPVLVSAIGRRYARREVAGGFPAAFSRAPADAGEVSAAPPVRWRLVDGSLPDDAPRRARAKPRASDRAGDRQSAPALPALWAEAPLPPDRTVPTPDRGIAVADRAERPGAAGTIALPGLTLRAVAPAEAARRLARDDDSNGPRGQAQRAPGEAGARRQLPPAPAGPALDIDMIVDRVQRELKRRERFERERKGLL